MSDKHTLHAGPTQPDMLAKINATIDRIADAEKITKAGLSVVSRDVLEYIVLNGSNDIGTVNRLLSVLTPMNYATSVLYFTHFLPFKWDEDDKLFKGRIKKEKVVAKKLEDCEKFMADEANDIWTWAEANVEIEKKNFDMAGQVTRAVELALNGKKESKTTLAADPISVAEILQAVVQGGVSSTDILDALANSGQEPIALAAE